MDYIRNWIQNKIHIVQESNKERDHFFRTEQDEIAKKNLGLLQEISAMILGAILLFVVITPWIVKGWMLDIYYLPLLTFMGGFFLFSFFYGKREKKKFETVQNACTLFCLALFLSVILIEVFPHTESPESFMGLCLVAIPMIFILRIRIIVTILILSESIFLILVELFKNPRSHDIFTTVAALVIGLMVTWIILNLRVRDGSAKMHYRRLSRMDSLTGILNKGTTESGIQDYLQIREEHEPCAFIMIDVDNFKKINDTLGHQGGDRVLEIVGNTLRSVFRAHDIIGRFGGDEFVVFMVNIQNEDIIQKKINHIREFVQKKISEDYDYEVTFSVGVAYTDLPDTSYDKLMLLADEALYEAKAFGKSRTILHHMNHNVYQKGQKPLMMVVDDNEINRGLLEVLFADEYDLIEAGDGHEALGLLVQYAEYVQIVLLDLIMPTMDGFTVLKYMRDKPFFKNVSVLVITGSEDSGEKVRALGATDVVTKPIDEERVRSKVKQIIKENSRSRI